MVNSLHPPPEVIASWPNPNYVDPQTQGSALVYLCIILSVIGICVVTARLYGRLFIIKAIGFDDALIVLALGFGIALSVMVIIGNQVWLSGHHVWDIPPAKFAGHRLNIWISEWCYVISLSCTKISVLLFYRRLSVKFTQTFMIATWVGIVYNALYLVGFGLSLLLLCRPLNAYWDAFDAEWAATHNYSCGREQLFVPLSGLFSVIGDLYSALLPMLVIVNLDLPQRQKLSLYALFSLAFLVVGAGVARTLLLNVVYNKNYDFTWVLWEMWIWGMVELYMALLAASAPALKPVFRKFFFKPISSVKDGSKGKRWYKYGCAGWRASTKYRGWGAKNSTAKDSILEHDPERIGVAYGGSDMTKSREESFVREVDDDDLETRHFELRHSRHGKIIPMQVWKKRCMSAATNSVPSKACGSSPTHDRGHIRNFSQPHSYTSSDTTTVTAQQVQRRMSQGSVRASQIGAQQHLAHRRDENRGPAVFPVQRERSTHKGGQVSRLDGPSDSDPEDRPWNDVRDLSRNYSTSDETLHLPRMGSNSDFQTSARKYRQ